MAKKRGRPKKDKVEETQNEEVEIEETTADTEPTNEQMAETIPETEAEQEVETTKTSDSNVVGDGTFSDYNPFAESVVERDYSTPKVASGVVEDIDEPQFIPPSYEDIVGGGAEGEGGEPEDLGSPFDNPNPAFNELENKDKKIACESLVDTALDAYEQLHKYAQFVVKVDEEELLQKHQAGKIDLNETIPVSENGDTMTISEFMGQYNQQGQEALSYDKEFGYKVRPAMVRVFMKKGWGMSDEQYLLYMFGKDIAVKVGIMYQLKKTINTTLETLEKAHKRNTGGGAASMQPEMDEFDDDDLYDDDLYEAPPQPPTQSNPPTPTPSLIIEEQEQMPEDFVDNSHIIDMPERKTPTILPKEVEKGIRKGKNKNRNKND